MMCVAARVWVGWAIGLAGVSACYGQETMQRHEFRQPHMGTEFTLILYTTEASAAKQAADAAFARIAQLNSILSDYDPESEAMRLCSAAGGDFVPVSDDLWTVLERSIAFAEKSDGAFDPTVGPVVRLWRRARRQRVLPDPELLAKARALVEYRQIQLEPAHKRVRLAKAGIKLDFGGIAKGYAADEALAVLKRRGISRALVAAAGDITCGDAPPGAAGWKVEVAALRADRNNQGSAPILMLTNRAVSTSGDAEQFVEIDGVRYSHIVDPRTGVGVVGRSSATIVASQGTDADALATAVSVLGPKKGFSLLDNIPGTAALYLSADETGIHTTPSKSWPELTFVRDASTARHDAAPCVNLTTVAANREQNGAKRLDPRPSLQGSNGMQRNHKMTYMVIAGFAFVAMLSMAGSGLGAARENPVVVIKTNMGEITVELDPEKAPITVENFLKYVDEGFYDGTVFHRVIDGFMIQGGGMTKDMREKQTKAPIKLEVGKLSNQRGTIAMARTNNPNSATSQFFINHKDNDALDSGGGGYAVFGKVTSGLDVVDKIAKVKTGSKGGHDDVPVDAVMIESIKRQGK